MIDWIRINKSSGSGNDTIIVTADSSTLLIERLAMVKVRNNQYGLTAQTDITQLAYVPEITGISFTSLTWTLDVPASGGTATSANTNFTIYGYYNDGSYVDITTACTVTGSTEVSASTATTQPRHTAGTLELTATYNNLSASSSVTIYQAGSEPVTNNWVSFYSASNQYLNLPSGYTFYVSWDKVNWTRWDLTSIPVDFGYGDKQTAFVRGKNPSGIHSSMTFSYNHIEVDVGGNAMALLDWETLPIIVPTSGFTNLFKGAKALQTVSSDFLPATTLGHYCYKHMFSGCTALTQAPALPATTLETSCYAAMFSNCTSLVNAPALPATELGYNCYGGMFAYCYSLLNAPVLPATTMKEYCYLSMFGGCTGLTTAPELPATELAKQCYGGMFAYCYSLLNAPELPATALTDSCYLTMFNNCIALTTAPELPATELAKQCYVEMFSHCYSLNEIHCSATNRSAYNCTDGWVNGVAPTGDFYGKASANWPDGVDGIPNGWNKHLD